MRRGISILALALGCEVPEQELPPLPIAVANNAVAGFEEVYAFSPEDGSYQRRADMATPVDYTVAFAYVNRYIYLVSGWHSDGNVTNVQVFDSFIVAGSIPATPALLALVNPYPPGFHDPELAPQLASVEGGEKIV